MAAPSGISWSDIQNSNHRLGIYTSISSTDSQSTVTIETWLWTKGTLTDNNNEYYFNNNSKSPTTLVQEDIKLAHTGSNWSTSNQTKLASHSYTYSRGTSSKNIYCAAKITPIGSNSSTVSHATSYTIPALPTYTVSYNANGGSGAPSSQTKTYGISLTLSSTKPTRTGYSFLGWATSSSATSATYTASGSYTTNAATTLYAVWKADTYTVSYNANGGSGAPSSQTKTYGVSLTLSSTEPTRTNYNFLGWGTSASSTTVAYSAGGSYATNATITLYAIWELAYTYPEIVNIEIERSDSTGVNSDDGSYFNISFNWSVDGTVTSIVLEWKSTKDSEWTTKTISASGSSGSVTQTALGNGAIDAELSYDVKITITDATGGSSSELRLLPGASYAIDFKNGGGGVAFGKPAEKDGLLDIAWSAKIAETLTVEGDTIGNNAEFSNVEVTNTLNSPTATVNNLTASTGTVNNLYDSSGTKLTNGLAIYSSSGIDPDTTLEHLILTHVNTPNGGYMYIKTEFYAAKTTSSNRAQTALPYKNYGSPYYRYYSDGAWCDWTPLEIRENREKVNINAQTTAQSVATSTNYTVYTWSADEDGLYGVSFTAYWGSNATGVRAAYIRKTSDNLDVAYDRRFSSGSATIQQNISGYVRLMSGQSIGFYVWHNCGSNLNLNGYLVQVVKISS